MPRIIFVAHDGARREVEAPVGETAMRAAVLNNIPGIDGDCGGECACATCHVFVDEAFLDRLAPAGELEATMLSFAAAAQDNSRLACQIVMSDALDGVVLETPEAQH